MNNTIILVSEILMKNFRHISKTVYTDITNTLTIVSLSRYSDLIFIRYSVIRFSTKLNTINHVISFEKK